MAKSIRTNIVSISADGVKTQINTRFGSLSSLLAEARYQRVRRIAESRGWVNSAFHTLRRIDGPLHRDMHKASMDAVFNRY